MPAPGRGVADSAELHHQELTLFLFLHLSRTPGVLWPDHEHPACRPLPRATDIGLLADGLTRLTGRTAHTVHNTGTGHHVRSEPTVAHTVVHQVAGSGNWYASSTATGSAPAAFHYRLRSGEVLYIPPHHVWGTDLSPASQYLVTTIA